MGTSPAVASSPLIDPRPLVETVEDEEENTVGELIAAAELANETLTAPSETTNSPTSPSLTTAHVLPQRHQQRPSHRACQEALSHIFGLPARPSRHPRVFQPRPTGWKPKRAAKRDRFQKRTHHYRDTHRTKHVSQPRTSPRCSTHLGVLRHLPPPESPTRNLPKNLFVAISASLTFCPLFWVPAFYNLLAGCWIWCHEGNLP